MTERRTPPALLIVRTWHEDGAARTFRAQIRIAMDVSSGSATTVSLADRDRVLEVVRAFLAGEAVPSTHPLDPGGASS